MTIATQRVQIDAPTYMMLDGQWQIVLPGSVIDLPASQGVSPLAILSSFSEPPGTLAPHGKATSVRNLRTR